VGAYYSGTGGPIQRSNFLIIEFDDKNIVVRREMKASVFSSRTPSVETFKSPQPSKGP